MICINCGDETTVHIPNNLHCPDCYDQGIDNTVTANLDHNNNLENDDVIDEEYDDEVELPYSFHTPMASRVKLNISKQKNNI